MQFSNYQRSDTDLTILNYGKITSQGKLFDTITLPHFVLHFVVEGIVSLTINNKNYSVGEKEMFFVPTNCTASFATDKNIKTTFYWVTFSGTKAKSYCELAGLSLNQPISPVQTKNSTVESFMRTIAEECDSYNEQSNVKSLGCLYLVLSELMKGNSKAITSRQLLKADYVQKAVFFIRQNYMNPITITDICEHIALSRTHFSKIFSEVVGISPTKYLIIYRINQAIMLMTNPDLSISQIAEMTGFSDLVSFSIRFKAVTSQSPNEYRKQMYDSTINKIRFQKETKKKKRKK